jgi:hypothetical protein
MREKDIRERIHLFLRNTVRHVVVPASMGIGLALVGGCPSSPPEPNPDGSADTSSLPPGSGGAGGTTSSAAGGAVALYMAVMPDASAGGATGTGGTTGAGGMTAVPLYMAMAGMTGTGGATATGGMTEPVLKYMAIMPDAGGGAGTGGGTSTGGVTAVGGWTISGGVHAYGAGMPATGGVTGAGGMTGPTPLYMAITPDAGTSKPEAGAVVKYMGPMPVDAGTPSTGGAVALYMAMMPDAGLTTRYASPQPTPDAGLGPMPLYMAPMPTKN